MFRQAFDYGHYDAHIIQLCLYGDRLLWHILHLDGVIISKSLSGDNEASLLGDYEIAMPF